MSMTMSSVLVAITKMAAARPNQQTLNQTADSLRASQDLLGHMSDLLSGAKVAVRRARRFHLRSASTMRHLQVSPKKQVPPLTLCYQLHHCDIFILGLF